MGSPEMAAADGAALVALAVRVVGACLTGRRHEPDPPTEPALLAPGASFVTLERSGTLRGCVGSLEPARSLYQDVVRNATRAMADPRLPRVTIGEWRDLDVTVSVLSRPEPLPAGDLAELTGLLRPGVDGLILSDGKRRATFLPAVWRKLPDAERFVAALLAKGGWSAAGAPPLQARRYTASEFHDPAPRAPLEP